MCGGEDKVWEGRGGQHRGEPGQSGVLLSCSIMWPQASHLTSASTPTLWSHSCDSLCGVGSHKACSGMLWSGGITRLSTPVFQVGQVITFHLTILNQTTCLPKNLSSRKVSYETIQPQRISHRNWCLFRPLCWIAEILSMTQCSVF